MRLLFWVVYAALILAWNYVCFSYYDRQLQHQNEERVVRPALRERRAVPSSRPAAAAAVPREKPIAQLSVQHPAVQQPAVQQPAVQQLVARPAARPDAQPAAAVATDDASCPGRRPYHTLLTTQGSTYQQWQSRIMYFHWKKQKAADGPCTPMTGFTRLVASKTGGPDGLEDEMPSYFVREYTQEEIARYGHFGVLNRPFSVQQMLDRGGFEQIAEDYIYIAETDHVLMRPLPNLASEEEPAAFQFGYMHPSASVQKFLDLYAAGASWQDMQPVGPSPAIVHKRQLRRITPLWLNISLALKLDRAADTRFGWVLEMWGYSMACGQLRIKHKVKRDFQVEGGGGISARGGQYIFHYTYGIEYKMSGTPQGMGTIGEWSLDKRHYGSAYPPRSLQPPPQGASDGAHWLCEAWNEASANIPSWPKTLALGTVGWRRVKGEGIDSSPWAGKLVGTAWTWAGNNGLELLRGGDLKTPWGTGLWGVLPAGVDYNDGGFCAKDCIYVGGGHFSLQVDFSGALHNVRLNFEASPPSFKTWRLGDGEQIEGAQVPPA